MTDAEHDLDEDEAPDEAPQWVDVDQGDAVGLVAYVARVAATKAALGHAPWRLGGALPFFRPKGVASFEKAHRGFVYEEQLYLGRGFLLFPQAIGAFLMSQMQAWSRQAVGGVLEFLERGPDGAAWFRFQPDAGRDAWRGAIVKPARKRLVLPGANLATAPALILPGGAR